MNRPNTPGFAGYVVAVLVSFAVFGTLVGFFAMFAADSPANALAIIVVFAPMAAIAAGTLGLPVAVVGAVLVALCLRRVDQQVWHVLGAGVVGAVLTPVYVWLLFGADGSPSALFAPGVGLAAALGRLAVVPLVSSRRRLAAEAG
ncbi:MAG: hypothetical protein ACJ72O_09125 [Marmoricola sp.]